MELEGRVQNGRRRSKTWVSNSWEWMESKSQGTEEDRDWGLWVGRSEHQRACELHSGFPSGYPLVWKSQARMKLWNRKCVCS